MLCGNSKSTQFSVLAAFVKAYEKVLVLKMSLWQDHARSFPAANKLHECVLHTQRVTSC
jgi:hypothetical protein